MADKLPEALRDVAQMVREWAYEQTGSPFSEEIYRTNVQISSALELLADRLTCVTQSTDSRQSEGGAQ